MTDALTDLLDAVKALQGEKSLRQWARELGVNRQTLWNVYNGAFEPSRHFLSRLVQTHGSLYPLVMAVLQTEKAKETDNRGERP